MEKSASKPSRVVRPRRKHAEMESFLKQFEKSTGLSVKDFCREHNLAENSFYSFRKRYRQRSSKEPTSVGRFITLEATGPMAASDRLFAEVKGIKLYQPVTAEYLKLLCS